MHPRLAQNKKIDVPDLNLVQTGLVVLLHVDVDGEMGVDVSHLVAEALGDADDQVVDEGSDGAEGGDVLPGAVVQLDVDDILLGVREVDRQVAEVLGEFACPAPSDVPNVSCSPPVPPLARTSWTLDGDQP